MPSEDLAKTNRHVCSDCGRSYKAAETLNRHRKNHEANTAYKCKICTASFKRKDLLDRHTQIHAGGKQATSRSRSTRACDRCSRLKTRCDNLSPCTRCARGAHNCTYMSARSRARIDRSLSITSSSVYDSPQLSAGELFGIVGDTLSPLPGHALPGTRSWTVDNGRVGAAWLHGPAWHLVTTDQPYIRPQPGFDERHYVDRHTKAFGGVWCPDPALEPIAFHDNLFDEHCADLTWYEGRHDRSGYNTQRDEP